MSEFIPEISICIPTYNQTLYLKKVLDSILIQTFLNYELIISDDSTSDDVSNLIDKYRGKFFNNITYVRNSTALGPPKNWNNAISISKGKWIKIMHHDDCFSEATSLQKFVDLTTIDDKIDFVFSGSFYFNSRNNRVNHFIDEITHKRININPIILFNGNLIGPPSAVMFKNRTSFFDEKLKWLVDIDFYYEYINKSHSTNYTSECLIESFVPEERVTNACWMNKFVEVPEYLYCINKHNISSFKVMKNTGALFYSLGVYSSSDIKECGFTGKIPFLVLYFMFKKRLINKIKYIFKKNDLL
jgi:glycosyltransferase involved in cell wall biosynthesis